MAFALERPATFDFRAGQFMVLVLPEPPHTDAEGDRRVFSIASPPQDATRLLLATRMTGTLNTIPFDACAGSTFAVNRQ